MILHPTLRQDQLSVVPQYRVGPEYHMIHLCLSFSWLDVVRVLCVNVMIFIH